MLHQYHIDFSQLSPDEKAALSDRIDNISFTGIQWEQGFQSGNFFTVSYTHLTLPTKLEV